MIVNLKVFRFIVAILGIASMACSGNQSQLEVTLKPTTAALIPAGTATVNGGAFSLTGPYFTLTSINLLWKGTGTVTILAITITFTTPNSSSSTTTGGTSSGTSSSTTSTSTGSCSFGGDDLQTLFPNLVTSTGVVELTQGQTVQASGPLGCSSLPVTVPIPNGFVLQGSMQVIGASLDSSGNTTGRVTGTANITVE